MSVTVGLIALAAALVAATALGLVLRWRAGRFRAAGPAPSAQAAQAAGAWPDVLTEAVLGDRLGQQATLVQFSPGLTWCGGCASTAPPTVLVLGPDGAVVKSAAGLPRKADVIAALGTVIERKELTPWE